MFWKLHLKFIPSQIIHSGSKMSKNCLVLKSLVQILIIHQNPSCDSEGASSDPPDEPLMHGQAPPKKLQELERIRKNSAFKYRHMMMAVLSHRSNHRPQPIIGNAASQISI